MIDLPQLKGDNNTIKRYTIKINPLKMSFLKELLEITPDPVLIDWGFLSMNLNIKVYDVENHPELPWDYRCLSANPSLTFQFILANLDKDWNWFSLSRNPSIHEEHIVAHPHLPWDWEGISCNHSISIEFLVKNRDKNIDWDIVSGHPNLTREIVDETYDTIPWDLDYIEEEREDIGRFYRPHPLGSVPIKEMCVTEKQVFEEPEHRWYWEVLSRNPRITINLVRAHLDKKWDWISLTMNPGIKMDDIKKHPGLPWKWNFVCRNPNFTMQFLRENREKIWNWREVCSCDFGYAYLNNYWKERKHLVHENLNKYKEELIAKACDPSRKNVFQWICDIEEFVEE